MTKLGVALLKLEGDWITWIDVAQQTIEAAKHVMEETPHNGAHLPAEQRMVA
jgi:hypothetical protein